MPRIYKQLVRAIATVDGDTFHCMVDFGWRIPLWPITLRLHGIDTPELRGDHKEAGARVRLLVRDWIARATAASNDNLAELRIMSASIDLYGRSLGDIEVGPTWGPTHHLGQWLLTQQLAKATSPTGKRPEWSARELLAILEREPDFPDFSLPASTPSSVPGQ